MGYSNKERPGINRKPCLVVSGHHFTPSTTPTHHLTDSLRYAQQLTPHEQVLQVIEDWLAMAEDAKAQQVAKEIELANAKEAQVSEKKNVCAPPHHKHRHLPPRRPSRRLSWSFSRAINKSIESPPSNFL